MSEIITKENERIIRIFRLLNSASVYIEQLAKNNRPILNGERYITDNEVSKTLKVCRRTTQQWRTDGQIEYFLIGGKALYKESDVQKLLENNYCKSWK